MDHYQEQLSQQELTELQADFPGFRIWREANGEHIRLVAVAGAAEPARTPWSPPRRPSSARCSTATSAADLAAGLSRTELR
jgi:hypothetical protein